MQKLIVKYELIDDENIEVTYSDNEKEIIKKSNLQTFSKESPLKMAFVVPN